MNGIHASCFGVTGDGVTSSSDALDAAIEAALAQRRPLLLPPGRIKIDRPIYLNRAPFGSITVVGCGRGYGTGNYETLIDATAVVDAPAMIIDFGRGCLLSEFTVLGPNIAPDTVAEHIDGPPADKAAWITTGVRDSQYSPQCGIAIDATVGVVPPDGGYPGLQYSGAASGGSADIVIRRVGLINHVVGILASPGISNQGDQFAMEGVSFQGFAVAIALCQTQSNATSIDGANFYKGWTCISTRSFGTKNGVPPHISNVQAGYCFQVFALQHALKVGSVGKLYTEGVKALGSYGTGSSNAQIPLAISDSTITRPSKWPLPPVVAEAWGPMLFRSVAINDTSKNEKVFNFAGGADLHFDFAAFASHAQISEKPFVARLRNNNQLSVLHRFSTFNGSALLKMPSGTDRNGGGRFVATYRIEEFNTLDGRFRYVYGNENGSFEAGLISNLQRNGADLSFDINTPTDICVGDILFWRVKALPEGYVAGEYVVPAVEVLEVAGNSVSARFLYDTDFEVGPDNGRAHVVVNEWAPHHGVVLEGDRAHGSNVLANVSNAAILRVGDFIKGDGLHARSRVTGIDIVQASVTLNRIVSGTGRTALHFGRVVPVTP